MVSGRDLKRSVALNVSVTAKSMNMPAERMKQCITQKERCILKMQQKSIPMTYPISTLLQEVFPVNHFQSQGEETDLMIQEERSSSKLLELLPLKDPLFCSLKMFPDCFRMTKAGHLRPSLMHWTKLGMMSRGLSLTAQTLVFLNQEKEYSLPDFLEENAGGEVFAFCEANPKTIVRRVPGSEGNRVYSADGLSVTLTAGGGGGGKTGLYLIPIPVKSKTKSGYQFAFPNDSIDVSYLTMNSRRGRVGSEIAHTLTTNSTQAFYFIDMNPNAKLTQLARCITARQDSGISHRHGEHSGVMVILKELTADELVSIGDTFHNYWTFENPNKETVTAMIIVDENGNFFVGYIRRLTPRECFRLQGFTDEQFDKVKALGMSDARLYKMAGNAVSVPVITAIGEQLKRIFYGGDK